ncbi:retrovirus-related pol polyprotein from transposon TNT 1-94 [Tanacetum coccineum]
MKSCGIVSQLTPPYTPKHNGVSERRNRTLLDMVQSMINLTTLPKSFWGYALESAARILNMVPTKKDTQRKQWVNTSTIHLRTRVLLLGILSSLRITSWYMKRDSEIPIDVVYKKRKIIGKCRIVTETSFHSGAYARLVGNCGTPIDGLELLYVLKFLFWRSVRIPSAPIRIWFYVDVEEYELGDLNESPNYKATLSDPEFDKWLESLCSIMNTKDMVLLYEAKPEAELKVSYYVDASFQTDKDDTKSKGIGVQAEYIAAAEASMKAVHMRKFIDGLGGVVPSNKRPMKMLCDNEPVIAIANDPRILKGA